MKRLLNYFTCKSNFWVKFVLQVLKMSHIPRNAITCSLFTFQIENKFSLNPKSDSCVRCGVIKAIEALQTSGSTVGATFILISQGKSTSLSSNFEKDLVSFFYIRVQWDLKSQLGVYTSPLLWVSFRGTQLLLHTHIL